MSKLENEIEPDKLTRFDQFYLKAKRNRWHWYFSIFCRISLSYAFIVAGMVKILGERFASGLSNLHPMGAYLEALHHTGYYYTFIGIAQLIAAIFLLIPRTVVLGAFIYFPIIVNICLLSFALRFEGSLVTSPLMVLANLYLLVWHYDKLRYLLPVKQFSNLGMVKKPIQYDTKFPFKFFSGVLVTVILTVLFARFGYEIMPRNSFVDCKQQFENEQNQDKGLAFCQCIHHEGKTLTQCVEEYNILRD